MGMGAFAWRCCEGKDKLTEQEARERAERLSKQKRRRVLAYECFVCAPNWHVGSVRGAGRKGKYQ